MLFTTPKVYHGKLRETINFIIIPGSRSDTGRFTATIGHGLSPPFGASSAASQLMAMATRGIPASPDGHKTVQPLVQARGCTVLCPMVNRPYQP